MKVIDIQVKGNLVNFLLGEDNCTDYYGDDWNDVPWQDNAGQVYDEFVKEEMLVAFAWGYNITDHLHGEHTFYSLEDLKIGLPYYYITCDSETDWGKLVGILKLETSRDELLDQLKNYKAWVLRETFRKETK